MRHPRRRLTPAAAVLTAAVLLPGCQGGGGTAPLSLKGLTETADGIPDGGADSCPLPYDLAAAAKEAGVDAAAGPGSARDKDEPAATGEGGKRAKPGETLAENPGALVSCVFHLGDEDVRVHTLATRDPSENPAEAANRRLAEARARREAVPLDFGAGPADPNAIPSVGSSVSDELPAADQGLVPQLAGTRPSQPAAPRAPQVQAAPSVSFVPGQPMIDTNPSR